MPSRTWEASNGRQEYDSRRYGYRFRKTKRRHRLHVRELKELEIELNARRIVLETAKMTSAVPGMAWDEVLKKAREHPVLLAKLEQKYKSLSDEVLGALDHADRQAKGLELLRKWQPAGPPN